MAEDAGVGERTLALRAGTWAIRLLGLGLLLAVGAGGAWAQTEDSSLEGIQKRLDELRVMYTDDHPEVMRLREHLRKAHKLEAQKKAQERADDPTMAPEVNRQFQEKESFE